MNITLNDKIKEVPDDCTVEQLCALVGIKSDNPVAVAVGFDVVERDSWNTTTLKENDKVTIIGKRRHCGPLCFDTFYLRFRCRFLSTLYRFKSLRY